MSIDMRHFNRLDGEALEWSVVVLINYLTRTRVESGILCDRETDRLQVPVGRIPPLS